MLLGQASSIRNVGRCIQSSGIELSGLIRTISFGGCCFESGRKEAGALIDIGGGTTDLAILKMVLFVIQR
jgi:cell division protein FtsA